MTLTFRLAASLAALALSTAAALAEPALVFDLGDLHVLSPRRLLRLEAALVTHAHMDHLIGFDTLLRHLVGREKRFALVGPEGIAARIGHKLQGYSWDLAGLYAAELAFEVTEVAGNSSAGIEVMESSGIAIYGNTLLDNPACIAFRNLPRGANGGTILANIHVYDNLCAGWTSAAIATGIGEWEGFDPSAHGIVIDRGRYLAAGRPLFSWDGIEAATPEDAALRLGFERNGRVD